MKEKKRSVGLTLFFPVVINSGALFFLSNKGEQEWGVHSFSPPNNGEEQWGVME